jgi:hypothetical protein
MCRDVWSPSPHSQTATGWSPKFPQVLEESTVSCTESAGISISHVSRLDSLFCLEECLGFAEGHTGAGLLPLSDDPLFRCMVLQHGQGTIDGLLSLTEEACLGLTAVSLSVLVRCMYKNKDQGINKIYPDLVTYVHVHTSVWQLIQLAIGLRCALFTREDYNNILNKLKFELSQRICKT